MINFTVDTRGNLKVHFDQYFATHPQIAKRFHMDVMNNQKEDFKCLNPSMIREAKLTSKDLHDIPRLKREIQEVYTQDHSDYRFLDLVFDETAIMIKVKDALDNNRKNEVFSLMKEIWDFWKDLRIVLSMIDDNFPLIRLKIYKRPELLVQGILESLETPPSYANANSAPVDYRDQDKGMILSLSARMNGITPDLAKFIWEYEDQLGEREFKSELDFFYSNQTFTNELYLTTRFEEIFREFYKVKTDQLGANGLPIYKYTEKHELARKFAHTFFQEYGRE